jgi:hypothetical protein
MLSPISTYDICRLNARQLGVDLARFRLSLWRDRLDWRRSDSAAPCHTDAALFRRVQRVNEESCAVIVMLGM